jgi:hypothetical protein
MSGRTLYHRFSDFIFSGVSMQPEHSNDWNSHVHEFWKRGL